MELPYSEAASLAVNFSRGEDFTEAEIDTLNLVPEEFRGLDRFEARKANCRSYYKSRLGSKN